MLVQELVDFLQTDSQFDGIINNRFAQFGIPDVRSYLGATIMPENTDLPQTNQYRESFIRYRSPIANASTRYSPPQMKSGTLVGSMLVELGESDIAAQFDVAEYDALVKLIANIPSDSGLSLVPEEAMVLVLRWFDRSITRPLVEFNEKSIWDCLVDAKVIARGDNGYSYEVDYPDPANARVNAGGNWGDPNYDPYPDIVAGNTYMVGKGYKMARQIASTKAVSLLLSNPKMGARLGIVSITSSVVAGYPGVVTLDALNGLFSRDGLPPVEKYDLQYQTQQGTGRFLKDDAWVQIASTDRDVEILGPDAAVYQQNGTLGYVGLGVPANRSTNGRAFNVETSNKKAAPIEAQGWQTSLPVNMFPDGVHVIKDVDNTGS